MFYIVFSCKQYVVIQHIVNKIKLFFVQYTQSDSVGEHDKKLNNKTDFLTLDVEKLVIMPPMLNRWHWQSKEEKEHTQ